MPPAASSARPATVFHEIVVRDVDEGGKQRVSHTEARPFRQAHRVVERCQRHLQRETEHAADGPGSAGDSEKVAARLGGKRPVDPFHPRMRLKEGDDSRGGRIEFRHERLAVADLRRQPGEIARIDRPPGFGQGCDGARRRRAAAGFNRDEARQDVAFAGGKLRELFTTTSAWASTLTQKSEAILGSRISRAP